MDSAHPHAPFDSIYHSGLITTFNPAYITEPFTAGSYAVPNIIPLEAGIQQIEPTLPPAGHDTECQLTDDYHILNLDLDNWDLPVEDGGIHELI